MGLARTIPWCVLLLWLLAFEGLPSASAHSFMLIPRADFSHFSKPECRLGGPKHAPNDTCAGPCIPPDSWQLSSNPHRTTYARGQNISVVWTKNNHHGGFIRLSLVPQAFRMDHEVHNRMAFRYACFDSDQYRCPFDMSSPACGTQHVLHRTTVQIPYSFPDGDYVLGWAWFGGMAWYGYHSYFGDYWSCANVRIRGGPLREFHIPVFHPGENVSKSKKDKCTAGVNMLGICSREPCTELDGSITKPYPFNESRTPPPILTRDSPYSNPFRNPHDNVDLTSGQYDGDAHVTQMKMIDLRSSTVLETEFYRTVPIESGMEITFKAFTEGPVSYVDFFLNEAFIRRERHAPYLMFGDHHGEISSWKNPVFGEWVRIKVIVVAASGSQSAHTYWFRLIKV